MGRSGPGKNSHARVRRPAFSESSAPGAPQRPSLPGPRVSPYPHRLFCGWLEQSLSTWPRELQQGNYTRQPPARWYSTACNAPVHCTQGRGEPQQVITVGRGVSVW